MFKFLKRKKQAIMIEWGHDGDVTITNWGIRVDYSPILLELSVPATTIPKLNSQLLTISD